MLLPALFWPGLNKTFHFKARGSDTDRSYYSPYHKQDLTHIKTSLLKQVFFPDLSYFLFVQKYPASHSSSITGFFLLNLNIGTAVASPLREPRAARCRIGVCSVRSCDVVNHEVVTTTPVYMKDQGKDPGIFAPDECISYRGESTLGRNILRLWKALLRIG